MGNRLKELPHFSRLLAMTFSFVFAMTSVTPANAMSFQKNIQNNSSKVLRYNNSKVHLQKVWKVGPTKDYSRFYMLMTNNVEGSSMKFSSEKSYLRTIQYWNMITADTGVEQRNEFDYETNTFKVHSLTYGGENNAMFAGKKRGTLKYYQKSYKRLKQLRIKNGMDNRIAFNRIQKDVMKTYSKFHSHQFAQDSPATIRDYYRKKNTRASTAAAITIQAMCTEAGIRCQAIKGEVLFPKNEYNQKIPTWYESYAWNRVKLGKHWYYVDAYMNSLHRGAYSLRKSNLKKHKLTQIYDFDERLYDDLVSDPNAGIVIYG